MQEERINPITKAVVLGKDEFLKKFEEADSEWYIVIDMVAGCVTLIVDGVAYESPEYGVGMSVADFMAFRRQIAVIEVVKYGGSRDSAVRASHD